MPSNTRLIQAVLVGAIVWLVLSGQISPVIGPPAPTPDLGLHVGIIEETGERDKLTSGQRAALLSTADGSVRDYCAKHCVQVNGAPEFRVVDKDASLDLETESMKRLLSRPHTSLPWLIVSNGKHGAEGPLPQTEEETLALLKRFGE